MYKKDINNKHYTQENKDDLLKVLKEQTENFDYIDNPWRYQESHHLPSLLYFMFDTIQDIKIKDAILGSEIYSQCRFNKCEFENVQFCDTLLLGTLFEECVFKNVKFFRVNSQYTSFRNCVFENCIFNNALSTDDEIEHSIIKNCSLEDAMFKHLECESSNIETTVIKYKAPVVFIRCKITNNTIKHTSDSLDKYYIIDSKLENNTQNLMTYENAQQNIGKLNIMEEIKDEFYDNETKKIIENKISDIISSAETHGHCLSCTYFQGTGFSGYCTLFENKSSQYKWKCPKTE